MQSVIRSSGSDNVKYDKQLEQLLKGLDGIDLTEDIFDETPYLQAHGGYCDVFKAKSRRHNNVTIAVKRLRVHIFKEKSVSKTIFRELKTWSTLKHPNVLPLLGYVMHGAYPAFVSNWMNKGSLRNHMDSNSDTSKVAMMGGIAAGLSYLHSLDIIHSDLKSENILVSDTIEPLLADFGISRVLAGTSITASTSVMGSARWMARELWNSTLDVKDGGCRHTKKTDIWALGMVAYELLTGLLPYYELKNDIQAGFAIASGQLPTKPKPLKNVDEELLWSICEQCWATDPSARPDAISLRDRLLGPETKRRSTKRTPEIDIQRPKPSYDGRRFGGGGGGGKRRYAYDSDKDDLLRQPSPGKSELSENNFDQDEHGSDCGDDPAPETSQVEFEPDLTEERESSSPLHLDEESRPSSRSEPARSDVDNMEPTHAPGSSSPKGFAQVGDYAVGDGGVGQYDRLERGSASPTQWGRRAGEAHYDLDPLSNAIASEVYAMEDDLNESFHGDAQDYYDSPQETYDDQDSGTDEFDCYD